MPYLSLDGASVYHEVDGEGDALVLLHGGFCSLEAMRELGEVLATAYRVHAAERTGHGRTADKEGPYSYAGMVQETLGYLDAVGIERAHVVGFSDGANVGLLLARDHPDRVRTLVAISGNLHPDCWVPEEQFPAASPTETHERVDREYAELSPDGPEHAEVVTGKLMALWQSEPQIAPESLAAISAPTLVMAGEHDMIAPEHTELIAGAIPGARLQIIDDVSHMLVMERPAEIGAAVLDFLART